MDLQKAARILKGHTVAPGVSLGVAPGSRQVLMEITADGTLETLIAAGARILESACGFCIGNHQSPGTESVSLRTSNRNFYARSGTPSANLYLVSPETAAASAITGAITDPRSVAGRIGDIAMKSHFIDDSMFLQPTFTAEVRRGPNIGEPPRNVPMADSLDGAVLIKAGDKITTDHIMPAGARLKYRSNIPRYAGFVFESVDPTFPARAMELKGEGKAGFIVAGWSYGQGSSREHAAICPMYLGVKAVLALSIERIHQANLCNFGILPLIFRNEEDYGRISQGDELAVADVLQSIDRGSFVVEDRTAGFSIEMDLFASEEQKRMLKAGGRLNEVAAL